MNQQQELRSPPGICRAVAQFLVIGTLLEGHTVPASRPGGTESVELWNSPSVVASETWKKREIDPRVETHNRDDKSGIDGANSDQQFHAKSWH